MPRAIERQDLPDRDALSTAILPRWSAAVPRPWIREGAVGGWSEAPPRQGLTTAI
ncbi:MAG: hypothetical protein WA715_03235 [Candidatus Acidiferrum sp.]